MRLSNSLLPKYVLSNQLELRLAKSDFPLILLWSAPCEYVIVG